MRCIGTCSTLHMHTQRAAFIIATRCVFGAKTVPFPGEPLRPFSEDTPSVIPIRHSHPSNLHLKDRQRGIFRLEAVELAEGTYAVEMVGHGTYLPHAVHTQDGIAHIHTTHGQ